ncbi:MAG TPA: multiheme c-type cytochrome [Candidatus Acidoferrum sp.]|nr:multiheme c-type cytochrome [Candidatus Acidoferrum sp.]
MPIVVGVLLAVAGVAVGAESVTEFVRRHWAAPLRPQGPPPKGWSALEASLQPKDCGTCHPVQYGDWRTSIHAASMGPGVAGQLVEMAATDPAAALECPVCHAPLAEQSTTVRTRSGIVPNPAHDPSLRPQGVVCASCHLRGRQRFGPPRRDGSLVSAVPRARLPHRGVTRTPAFLSSEFCRDCHQFKPDGFAVNGKLLQNTYEEWKASPFAREGTQCQDCHMPDRRHLWRGIHDEAMVRSGLEITLEPDAPALAAGGDFTVTLAVRNARVGHAFPTYVTPRVILRGERIDGVGQVIAASRREIVIAREVELDLSREFSDTRLAPGQSARLRYTGRAESGDARVRLSVIVEPDAFYTRFFETLLAQGAGRGESQIREALEATRRSPFVVFQRELAIGGEAAGR